MHLNFTHTAFSLPTLYTTQRFCWCALIGTIQNGWGHPNEKSGRCWGRGGFPEVTRKIYEDGWSKLEEFVLNDHELAS